MSMLDISTVVPSEIMPIICFCGNLPLCLGVVSGMIRANSNSVGDVLEMLKEDRAGVMTEEAAFSVPELIVGRSVKNLGSTDAQELFELLGTSPEDASVPTDFMVVLWKTTGHSSTMSDLRLKSSVKKLVAVLVLNNLLHSAHRNQFTMHDIVSFPIRLSVSIRLDCHRSCV
jgi:hypothetical protein